MQTREQHLQWCKDTAMDYVKRGDLTNAVASMMSDLGKHPETEKSLNACAVLGLLAAIDAQKGDRQSVERFILGFN